MFDRGVNWKKRQDGTFLYNRSPSEPTFIIDERTLDEILWFRWMLPLVSFLLTLPVVVLGVLVRHGDASMAVAIGALLAGLVLFYVYFRSVERRIKAMLRDARRSAETIEPLKVPPNGRNWRTLQDGSVHYWPRAADAPVVLTGEQFMTISKDKGHLLSLFLLNLAIAVGVDGYWWAGDMSDRITLLSLLALAVFDFVVLARLLARGRAIVTNAPPASDRRNVQPPRTIAQVIGGWRAALRRQAFGFTMLLILVCIAVLGVSISTLASLANGEFVYWADLPVPVGPLVPTLASACSLMATIWLAGAMFAHLRSGREK